MSSCRVVDLRSLWFGDEQVSGYAHPALALAIARIVEPADAESLLRVLYPEPDKGGKDWRPSIEVQRIIETGFSLWQESLVTP